MVDEGNYPQVRDTLRAWHPWSEIRHRPITAIIVALIGVYMIWFGVVLLYRQEVPGIDPRQFSGPLLFWSLDTWGYIYIALGCVKFLRVLFMQYGWLSRILHIGPLLVLTEWAVALDASQLSLLQPATTLVALLSLFNPWITNIIARSGEPEYLLQKQQERDAQLVPHK